MAESTGTKETEAALRLKLQDARAALHKACRSGNKDGVTHALKIADAANDALHAKLSGKYERLQRELAE